MRTLAILLAMVSTVLAADQPRVWREQIKTALSVSNPLPPLAPETHGKFEPEPGVIAERVTYGTQFGLRIPAILYLPKERKGKIPALIVVNGHGGDKFSWYAFYSGVSYARGGAAVLTYDPAGEGERNINRKSGTRAHDVIQSPDELGRRLGGLMITEVMQAVSYLAQRPEVDASRIGAMGYSMGSFVLSLAGAVETRLNTCVLVGGGNLDGPGEYWDTSKPMCQGLPYKALTFLGDRAATIYALHALRGPTLIFNGTEDSIIHPKLNPPRDPFRHFEDLQRRAGELSKAPHRVFETGYEKAVGHRPFFVTRPVALWLEQQLDFPNWTEAGIRALPETHIGEWAQARGVAMDKLYATEHREGGVRALGEGVPGLSRETLCVFTPAEWEREKSRMIHETWLAEARRRL
jgi:dienelactone hydrolase